MESFDFLGCILHDYIDFCHGGGSVEPPCGVTTKKKKKINIIFVCI